MNKAMKISSLMRTIMINEQRSFEKMTVNFNVSASQARTMGYLQKNPGVNQKQIAEHFHHRGASTSGLLKNLEKLGYIEKHVSKGTQDRSKKIYLTSLGEEVTNQLTSLFQKAEKQITADLNDTDVDQLITLLNKINDSMQ